MDSGDKEVFAFARVTDKGEGAIIVLNCSAEPKKLQLRGLPTHAQFGELVLASPKVKKMESTDLSIAPYAVVINKFTLK